MRRAWLLGGLGVQLGLLAVASAAQQAPPPASEISRLLRESRSPVRFRDHQPKFDIRPQTFTFKSGDRSFQETYYAVVDGSRIVALCDPGNTRVEVLASTPDEAPVKLDLTAPLLAASPGGTRLEPRIRLGGRLLEIDQRDCHFSKEEAAAVVIFRQEWALPRKGHSTSIFRFRLDPVRGYVVEVISQVFLAPDGAKKNNGGDIIGVLAMQPARMDDPWPGACEFDRTAYTHRGGTGYGGWWNNFASAPRLHGRDDFLPLREGGFLAYLGSKPAWIPAISYPDTVAGAPLHRIDPGSLEQQCYLIHPAPSAGEKNKPLAARLEFGALPPEAGAYLSQRVDMGKWESQRAVMLRLGRTEDFEDQPLPLSTPARALVSPVLQLSTREAHSGKNSLIVLGTAAARQASARPQFTTPALPLAANSRYRVSVWAKSGSGITDGALSVALHSSPELQDEGARRFRSSVVKTGQGWRMLSVEFESGPFVAFADLRLQAIGNGSVYFDDFSFTRLER